MYCKKGDITRTMKEELLKFAKVAQENLDKQTIVQQVAFEKAEIGEKLLVECRENGVYLPEQKQPSIAR